MRDERADRIGDPTQAAATRRDSLGRAPWGLAVVVALGLVAAGGPMTQLRAPYAALPPLPTSSPAPPVGESYYAAPSGRPTNPGTIEAPLDLAKALSEESPAGPGDTIWLRAGVYPGTYVSALQGREDAPIVVRQYPGELAIIDSSPHREDALFVKGAFTWFWGFEVRSSEPNRISKERNATDIRRGGGVVSHAPGAKFINLVIHDLLGGMGIWASSPDAEVYGNLVYHNGYMAADRGHGHGIYAQNRHGRQQYIHNILFGGFGYGFHAYGSDAAYLNNFHLEGNIVFNSGVLAPEYSRNILIGGGRVADQPTVIGNYTFYDEGLELPGGENHFGYSAGCTNLVVKDNYFAHVRKYPLALQRCDGAVENNVLIGWTNEETRASYSDNTFHESAPGGVRMFVLPNRYERGRAHVAIYNWDQRPHVSVNLSTAGLQPGQRFEIRDAQNFFGAALVTGRFEGVPVDVSMDTTEAARPIGNVPAIRRHTPRQFGAFIVIPLR